MQAAYFYPIRAAEVIIGLQF